MSSRDELVSLIRAARANGLAMEEEAESILAAGWRPPLDRQEAQRECVNHDWDMLYMLESNDPYGLICGRCGRMLQVVRGD